MSSSAGESSPQEQRAADIAAETQRKAEELAQETTAKADSLAEETAAKAFALAESLDQTLVRIAERLDQYSAFGRRSRQIIAALVVSFALDIVFTVVLGLTAVSAHGTASANADLVQALHTAQLTVCASGNTFRADQNTIWRDFITIITKPVPGEPAAQITKTNKLAAQFLTYVATVNHPNDCTALYGK